MLLQQPRGALCNFSANWKVTVLLVNKQFLFFTSFFFQDFELEDKYAFVPFPLFLHLFKTRYSRVYLFIFLMNVLHFFFYSTASVSLHCGFMIGSLCNFHNDPVGFVDFRAVVGQGKPGKLQSGGVPPKYE